MDIKMLALIFGCLVASASVAGPAADEMTSPALEDVRLKGIPAEKMNDLFHVRITSAFAQRNVFGEARRAFVERDDDERGWEASGAASSGASSCCGEGGNLFSIWF